MWQLSFRALPPGKNFLFFPSIFLNAFLLRLRDLCIFCLIITAILHSTTFFLNKQAAFGDYFKISQRSFLSKQLQIQHLLIRFCLLAAFQNGPYIPSLCELLEDFSGKAETAPNGVCHICHVIEYGTKLKILPHVGVLDPRVRLC